MTLYEQLITIAVAVIALQACRWVAFWAFPTHRPIPPFVEYLGKVLPSAVFGLLVVYCYKHIDLGTAPHGAPELISGLVVVILHKTFKNMFVSIGVGTLLYMFLVQTVFAPTVLAQSTL